MEWYEYVIAFVAALGVLLLFCIGVFGADTLSKRKGTDATGKEKNRRTPKSEDENGRFRKRT